VSWFPGSVLPASHGRPPAPSHQSAVHTTRQPACPNPEICDRNLHGPPFSAPIRDQGATPSHPVHYHWTQPRARSTLHSGFRRNSPKYLPAVEGIRTTGCLLTTLIIRHFTSRGRGRPDLKGLVPAAYRTFRFRSAFRQGTFSDCSYATDFLLGRLPRALGKNPVRGQDSNLTHRSWNGRPGQRRVVMEPMRGFPPPWYDHAR
jgi:hypothetical protein